MKAVICPAYGPPEVLQLQDIEIPVPKDKEVRIKIHATTATVADFRIRSFTVPKSFWIPARLALGITKPRKPILGVELSGEIEYVGKNVTRFKKGDQVFAATLMHMGAYAEYICLPEDGPIAIKPDCITYEEAAAIPVGARTALHYLRKGEIKSGKKILIYGASGSVGTYAVQLARYFGAEVTGVCSSTNLALVKSLGADHAVDYTIPGFISRLGKYDVVFVAVDKISFIDCKKLLQPKGIYLNITEPLKSFEMLWTSMTTGIKVVVGENSAETADDLNYLKDLVEAGVLKPVIDKKFTLDQIVDAHRYVEMGHKKGNVVITVA
jgi:NADPH:quinone reductase-like Zn-dependent oxidoreductase